MKNDRNTILFLDFLNLYIALAYLLIYIVTELSRFLGLSKSSMWKSCSHSTIRRKNFEGYETWENYCKVGGKSCRIKIFMVKSCTGPHFVRSKKKEKTPRNSRNETRYSSLTGPENKLINLQDKWGKKGLGLSDHMPVQNNFLYVRSGKGEWKSLSQWASSGRNFTIQHEVLRKICLWKFKAWNTTSHACLNNYI